MATDDIGKKIFILLIGVITFLVLGSFVVSFNIIHFVYLLILYIYVYRIYRGQKMIK